MEVAGNVVIQIGGDLSAFEAALARAKEQATAFDAQISAKLSGTGMSAGLAKIAGLVEQNNALLTKLTSSGTAATATMAKLSAATTETAATLAAVSNAARSTNVQLGTLGSGGAAFAAATISAKEFALALEQTGGNLTKITPQMLGLAEAETVVAASSKSAAAGMTALGVAEAEAAGLGAGVTREFSVLGAEIARGNFSRIPGSLIVMNERLAATGAGVLTLTNFTKAFGALGSVIFNPYVLGFLAISTGIEVASRAFGSLKGGLDEATTALEEHKKTIDAITAAYPEAQAAAKKFADQAKDIPKAVAASKLSNDIVTSVTAMDAALKNIEQTLASPILSGGRSNFDGIGLKAAREFAELGQELKTGTLDAVQYQIELAKISIDPSVTIKAREYARALQDGASKLADLEGAAKASSVVNGIVAEAQKAKQTLFDISAGFKEVKSSAGSADATISKLFGTLNNGGDTRFGITRSIADQFGSQFTGQLQGTLGMFQTVDQAVQQARQDQLASMLQLQSQFRATTTEVDVLKQALATAGGKDNIRDFFGDVSNITNANAEIENSVATVQKLFAAMATGNTSVNAVSQGLEMIRQTLINDGFPVDKIDVFLNRLVQANRELVADQGQVHQLGAAINALHDRTITITVQTRQVGSGLQSSYQVPTTYGGAESAGTGSSYGVSGSSNVNVTRFSSTDRQISQTPIFNTSTNSWGYVQPTTYQDPNVLAQVNAMYPARAAGGPIAANMPYWVGEHGPELVMPSSAGTVIPNAQSMALANPQSAFTGQVATSDANRMWTLQMNIEGNTRKTTQLLDEIKAASASTSSALGSSSYGGGSTAGGTDSQHAAYMAALATARSNYAAIGGRQPLGYGLDGLAATPEQIAHRAVYGFNSGGMIAPGDTQQVKFFKSPDEAVAIFTPQQLKAIQGANQNQPAAANNDQRPISVTIPITVQGGAQVSKDSVAEMRRQFSLALREGLRGINGR